MSYFDIDRDGGNYSFEFGWIVPPPNAMTSGQMGSVNVDVVNAETGTIIAADVAATYVSNLKMGRIVRSVVDLLGIRKVAFVVKPQGTLTPDYRFPYTSSFTVSDSLKRQDEVETKIDTADAAVDTLQSDFDAFEAINQGEHDATQAAIAAHDSSEATRFATAETARATMQAALVAEHDATQTQLASHESASASRHTDQLAEHDATQAAIALIAGAAEGYLYGPSRMSVPASGTKVYVLRALIRDLDTSPTALVDPDNQRVTLTAKDSQTGSAPTGIALSDADGGVTGAQMTWLAAGDFEAQITLDPTALEDRSIIFEATWAKGGITNKAILICVTSDENAQLARIESAVSNLDGDLAAHEAARAAMQTALQAEHDSTQSQLAAHDSAEAGRFTTAEANRAAFEGRMQTEHDSTQSQLTAHDTDIKSRLDHATTGLAALNTDLDAILSNLGAMDAETVRQKLIKLQVYVENMQGALNNG